MIALLNGKLWNGRLEHHLIFIPVSVPFWGISSSENADYILACVWIENIHMTAKWDQKQHGVYSFMELFKIWKKNQQQNEQFYSDVKSWWRGGSMWLHMKWRLINKCHPMIINKMIGGKDMKSHRIHFPIQCANSSFYLFGPIGLRRWGNPATYVDATSHHGSLFRAQFHRIDSVPLIDTLWTRRQRSLHKIK